MSIREQKTWITGDEFAEARRRLLVAGLKDDSPEMQNLLSRLRERDDYLWQHFAAPHIRSRRGQWAAVGLNGEIVFGPTASAVMANATDRFGTANFVLGRLSEFQGSQAPPMLISDRFPYVEVEVSIGTWSFVEFAYIDTGFEGGLLIPSYLKDEILAGYALTPLEVADGAVVLAPQWDGHLELNGHRFRIEVSALGAKFLLGRDVTDILSLHLDHGRRVRVDFDLPIS